MIILDGVILVDKICVFVASYSLQMAERNSVGSRVTVKDTVMRITKGEVATVYCIIIRC